jgi:hypothetical protein
MNEVKGKQQAPKARWEDLVLQEMPDEVLVYDLKGHKAHMLNQTAAFVWNHCDGQTTASEMAALMAKESRSGLSCSIRGIWGRTCGRAVDECCNPVEEQPQSVDDLQGCNY